MKTFSTDFGAVRVGASEALFGELVRLGTEAWRTSAGGRFSWALTGGSTPKAWYRWAVAQHALPAELVAETEWFVSDERCVPLISDESNFGNAARLLLDPFGVPVKRRHPWPVELAPSAAGVAFAATSDAVCGVARGFSLCVLGLGDDAHTASLFPGSPLLGTAVAARFAAVEVPGKGWRLTLTPAGLATCERIVVHATGAGKATAVRRIFGGAEPESAVPAKVLRSVAARTTWLLDEAAVAECTLLH
ncbi:MAG: 6-phosphogluconolactonase [Opitutaceae bacterium]